MNPRAIEAPGHSALMRVSARLKLLATLLLVSFTALLPRRPSALYLIPTLILLSLWLICRMPLRYVLPRLVLVELFILGFALLSLFHPATFPIFVSMLFKSNLCVFAMLLLSWTTPFHEVLQELRRLQLPAIMVTILALMVRYLPLLREETRRMSRARASRTFTQQRRVAWQTLALIIGQLFVRSAERAERIYLAMCARGWK